MEPAQLDMLQPREAVILAARWGLIGSLPGDLRQLAALHGLTGSQPQTQRAVGVALGLSGSRVGQLEQRARKLLRDGHPCTYCGKLLPPGALGHKGER